MKNKFLLMFLMIIFVFSQMCYVYAYDTHDTHKGESLSALEKLVPGWISNFGEVSSSTDLRTHPWLTLMAIKLYEESNPAIALNDKVQIIMGSIEEDYDIKGTSTIEKYSDITPLINLDFFDEINFKIISNRSVNHFMGPDNMPLDNIIGNGDKSALDWAKDEPSNLKNFSVAIRDKDLRALGHALHLLQDMSVPAHVRNDSHAEQLYDTEKYEYYLAELTPKDYNNRIGRTLPPSFNNIVELFTKLSDYTRNNYFSDDTIFSNHYRGMTLPIATSTTEDFNYFYSTSNRRIAYKGALYYITRIYTHDPLNPLKFLNDTHPEIVRKTATIDNMVLEDSFKDLGSKAIGYSAKLIELYYNEVGTSTPVAKPTFNPPAGTYSTAQTITINCTTADATIKFTLDGSTPSKTHGDTVTNGNFITISTTKTINAMAYKTGLADSAVVSATYTINQTSNSTIDKATATFDKKTPDDISVNITLSSNTVLSSIKNGSTALTLNKDYTKLGNTVKIKTSYLSTLALGNTTLTFDFSAGTDPTLEIAVVDNSQPKTLSSIDLSKTTDSVEVGAIYDLTKILVTANYSDATKADKTSNINTKWSVYSGGMYIEQIPIINEKTEPMRAGSILNNIYTAPKTAGTDKLRASYSEGGITRYAYLTLTITALPPVATPTFTPDAGTYSSGQSVTISCTTSGATIKYTTDGSIPSQTHGTTINSGNFIPVPTTMTVNAIAYKAGMTNSEIKSAKFIINDTTSASDFEFTDNGSSVTITGYKGTGGAVVIPNTINGNPVASIGPDAFSACYSLTSITIPSNVTSIGSAAFNCCIGLKSITIPGNVTSIGVGAFEYCAGLTSVDISNGVTSIGYGAFQGCSGLTSVTIPNSVTSIGHEAFYDCKGLTNITIGNGVKSIEEKAFGADSNLIAINIDVSNLNYTSIDGALYNKNKTTLIKFPDGKSGIFTIPSSVTNIGNYAFDGCNSLTSVTIPNSVTGIGNYAFNNCNSLTSVTIPNSVTSIGNSAFSYCKGLTGVTIGNSVTSIGGNAFQCCSGLTSIIIPKGVTSIEGHTFYCCIALTSVTIPDSVTSIGILAFIECTSLTNITIPDSVTSIGSQAFSGCRGLTSVIIGNGLTSIGNTFGGCTSLTSVTIGNNVANIGDGAFACCTSLKNITIPDKVSSIGDEAFSFCNNLTSANFKGNAPTTFLTNVFANCAANFKIYYQMDKTGWTTPTWNGYPTEVIENLNAGSIPTLSPADNASGISINSPLH